WDINTDPATSQPRGKDFDNVIILLCANSGRAQNIFGQLYSNVIDNERYYIGIEADAAVNSGFAEGRAVKMTDLDGSRLPADMPLIPGKTTLLHEIGHSLGLGDEYGENQITKDDPRLLYTGTGSIDSDKQFSNIQVKSDLVVSAGSDSLDADKVKWRWHRIAKSGVLAPVAPPAAAAITQSGSRYTIKLMPGQAAAFAANDVVFLRRRKLGESILQDIGYSQVSAPRYPFVTRSPELIVREVDDIVDVVVVEPQDSGALTGHDLVADFPAECVLYKPLPARTVINEFPPAGALLELTAANVLNFIDNTGLPLHEKKDSSGNLELDFDPEQSPNLVDITVALCAKKNRNVVGLYAGGFTYHHGLYHPAGHCIMRDNHQVAEFCSVCKYILTDFIDPSLHPETDKLIEEYYPLKANQ
ncbi:MAG TPA: M64 family metallopeptidase, partial [Anaerolineales bacterium]|nr:M64 family metallopeptidase [Anaerolineales bacterium]